MTNTLFLLFIRAHPLPQPGYFRLYSVEAPPVWRSNQSYQKTTNKKLRQVRRKSPLTIPKAMYSRFSVISCPAFRVFYVLRSLKHDDVVDSGAPRCNTSPHAVELLLSSAPESQRWEPRFDCPSRVIPPLSLLSLLPGRMRHSVTLCTLILLTCDHVLKSINSASSCVTRNSGHSKTEF